MSHDPNRSLPAIHVAGFLLAFVGAFAGCKPNAPGTPSSGSGQPAASVPSFQLAWSEYPSWSVFGVAHEKGLIDKDAGKMGSVEKKWNVDIVLIQADYDPCLQLFASGKVEAVCITNMDVLAPASQRDCVAILPTSTSFGADACIAVGASDVDALAGKPSYGLEKSVSQYTFERNLQILGKRSQDYPFKNMDPGAAAQAMMSGQADIQSIVVWNPFVMETLRKQPNAKVLFDSTAIPEEIIDMVVVSKATLAAEGGEAFACAIIDSFYQLNQMLEDPKTADATLVALGAKFSSLGLEDMRQVVQQTRFYKTPDQGQELFQRADFQTQIMPRVIDFCAEHDIVEAKPKVAYDDDSAGVALQFSTKYIQQVRAKK